MKLSDLGPSRDRFRLFCSGFLGTTGGYGPIISGGDKPTSTFEMTQKSSSGRLGPDFGRKCTVDGPTIGSALPGPKALAVRDRAAKFSPEPDRICFRGHLRGGVVLWPPTIRQPKALTGTAVPGSLGSPTPPSATIVGPNDRRQRTVEGII